MVAYLFCTFSYWLTSYLGCGWYHSSTFKRLEPLTTTFSCLPLNLSDNLNYSYGKPLACIFCFSERSIGGSCILLLLLMASIVYAVWLTSWVTQSDESLTSLSLLVCSRKVARFRFLLTRVPSRLMEADSLLEWKCWVFIIASIWSCYVISASLCSTSVVPADDCSLFKLYCFTWWCFAAWPLGEPTHMSYY